MLQAFDLLSVIIKMLYILKLEFSLKYFIPEIFDSDENCNLGSSNMKVLTKTMFK
jgi:hypothetical protein